MIKRLIKKLFKVKLKEWVRELLTDHTKSLDELAKLHGGSYMFTLYIRSHGTENLVISPEHFNALPECIKEQYSEETWLSISGIWMRSSEK